MKIEQRNLGRRVMTGLALLTAVAIPFACENGCASYHQRSVGKTEDYSPANSQVVLNSSRELQVQAYQI